MTRPVTVTLTRADTYVWLSDLAGHLDYGRHVHSVGPAGEVCESGECADPAQLELQLS